VALLPHELDRANPTAEIARAAKAYSNWGRWGADDVPGAVSFPTGGGRRAAAGLVRRGANFSLAQRFDMNGPSTSSCSPPRRCPSPARSAHRSTRSPSSSRQGEAA
jgi:hypothetical protein